MANKITVNLDTFKNNYDIFECKQNDDLTLEANIFENGIEKIITNAAITINCTRSDNTFVIQDTDIIKEKNKIKVELKRDFTRVGGLDKLEIVLVENGKQNTTFDFNILVKNSVINGAVESANNISILENLQNNIVLAVEENLDLIKNTDLATTENTKATVNIENLNAGNTKGDSNILTLKAENTKATVNIPTIEKLNVDATTNITELGNNIALGSQENTKLVANIDKATTQNTDAIRNIETLNTENINANSNIPALTLENTKAVENIPSMQTLNLKSAETITELENKILEAGQVKEDTEALIQNGGAATTGDIAKVNSQLAEKANKLETQNIQQQVNNLVLGAVGDGNNAEVIQARGEYSLLDERLNEIDYKSSNLVKRTKQLYDKNSCEIGKVISSDGSITGNADYKISEFIHVESSTIYSGIALGVDKIGFLNAVLYDTNKQFITRLSFTDGTITTTPTTKYIRLNVGKNESNAMFNEGSLLLNYEPYGYYTLSYKKEEVDDKLNNLFNYENSLSFIQKSKNIYNCNDINNVKGYVISADGIITGNSQYEISDYINLKPNTKYTGSSVANGGFNSIALYDENKNFIKRTSISSSVNTITTPINAKYGRLNAVNGSKVAMFNEGDTLLPFEPYGTIVENKLMERYIGNISKSNLSNKMNDYILPPFCEGKWYKSEGVLPYESLANIPVSTLFERYDLLLNNSNYVVKTLLGKDTSGLYDIYKYSFSSTLPNSEITLKKPKILIATVHSAERPILLAVLNLFTLLCNNWRDNPILEYLRWNIDFEVIPCANPWGYENNKRGNVNHVDINRSFDFNWINQGSSDVTSDNYRGTSPHSENETKYIVDMLNNNKDAIAVLDLHTWGTGSLTWSKVCSFGVPTFKENNLMLQIAIYVLSQLTNSSQKHLNVPTDSGFVGEILSSDYNSLALLSNYATSLGFNSITPEGGYKYVGGQEYTNDINNFNIEFLTNTILTTIKTLLYN